MLNIPLLEGSSLMPDIHVKTRPSNRIHGSVQGNFSKSNSIRRGSSTPLSIFDFEGLKFRIEWERRVEDPQLEGCSFKPKIYDEKCTLNKMIQLGSKNF